MEFQVPEKIRRRNPHRAGWGRSLLALVMLAMTLGVRAPALNQTALAAPTASIVTMEVYDRETGLPLADGFRYIINVDIANDNASVTHPRSYSPLVATGDESSPTVSLGPGRYLVTVLGGPFPAVPGEAGRECSIDDPCGYKLGGQHFTVDTSGAAMTVQVNLVPNPLPLATIRVRVFNDNNLVNGEDDIPFELGIPDFPIVISDPTGEVTVDFFGNPICTEYSDFPGGTPVPGTGGQCQTGPDGIAVIPNLPPLKYEVEAVPPDGSGWYQTTTIEGTHANDAWVEEGASGFSTEEGFLQAVVWFGFVKPCTFGDTADTCPTNDLVPSNAGSITGRIRQIALDNEGPLSLGKVVPYPLVALNNIGGDDEQVYMARGNADGTFFIPNVPPGLYQLVYWDYPQDYLIQFATVNVGPNEAVDMGDLGTPRWFGTIQGYAYMDSGVAKDGTLITAANTPGIISGPDPSKPGYANRFRDCYDAGGGIDPNNVATCEPGLTGQDFDIRFKDGSVKYATFADTNGYYEFPEYFEWEHWLIWEVGFGRFAHIGTASYATDEFGDPIGYPYSPINGPAEGLGGLLQSQMTWAGTYQWIDAGKLPYALGENGGISGIVFYATTRNEFSPRYAAAEDYEPGIPGVTVNLYQAALDGNDNPLACTAVGPGCPYGQGELMRISDTPFDSVQTDSWYDNLPVDCTLPDFFGTGVTFDPECFELPRTWNQIKDGVFDGGYAFEGTPPGKYIVEVVPPAGYREIRDEDQNTDQGDYFIPQVPPSQCAGPLHLVVDPRNPADGTETPLCNSRLVTVVDGFNAPSDFYLMTDNAVPPPGMIRGLLVDDLTVQLDPANPLFVDKRGIPNTPIGILDFQGNEIARVYSDENGYWEVLLPSTYTALCPTPGGVCPGMYQVVGNYPGNPLNPDPLWNPNYGSLRLVFDVWPGKTTYADVALFPITGFVQDPSTGFRTPPVCNIPTDTPELRTVSQAFGSPGDTFTITGTGFGAIQGNGAVTLDGAALDVISWSDMGIEVEIPAGQPVGPQQLLVTNNNGRVSLTGLTFHVLGVGYNPPRLYVDDDAPDGGTGGILDPFNTIQEALDASLDGDLILVNEGIYYENIIVYTNVKLQGLGPGATLIDGRFFNFGGMTPDEFQDAVNLISPVGPSPVPMGQVVTVLAQTTTQHGAAYNTQVDGFAIRGGSRVRNNVAVSSQGGGIYAHAYIRNLEVSNNLIQSNAGNLGGGVILGQPYVGDNENDAARIHHNRVLNNGGVSLAGGFGLFNGANGYEIDNNVVCGNYSAEYGGGISHYGMSPGGQIHDNQILFNYAFDEGGGIMIAGEQPNNPLNLSAGSGDVRIERNRIQGNVSNDDGGGIRLLQPVVGPVDIINNFVVNNLATDIGGGISLDDALNTTIINNTIARNVSTATAEDADRSTCIPPAFGSCPHSAGISSEPHSLALRNAYSLPADSFSDPLLFNNIIWRNEAFYLDGTGALPSAGYIDLEVVGTTSPQSMTPDYSLLTALYGTGVGNIDDGTLPGFVAEISTNFIAVPFAGDPSFVTVLLLDTPGSPQGNYHLEDTSAAIDEGVASFSGTDAPPDDIDGDSRPQIGGFDMGADEFADLLFFTTQGDSPVPGVTPTGDDANIYTWNGDSFGLMFDAEGAGLLPEADIDALVVVNSDQFYASFDSDGLLFSSSDILFYDNGSWSLYFDGSDVGLTGGAENVDAFEILTDGSVLVSTVGAASVPGASANDQDFLRCVGSFGTATSCTWSVYLEGADIGLGDFSEGVDGGDLSRGNLYLTTRGVFDTGSLAGEPEDVFVCEAFTPGTSSACSGYSAYFDGSVEGITDSLDGISLRPESLVGVLFGLSVVNSQGDALKTHIGAEMLLDAGPMKPGSPVAFSAKAVAAGNLTYTWDFGDGSAGSGAEVQHTYRDIGTYTVVLTVSNGEDSVKSVSVVQIGWQTFMPLIANRP